MKRSRKILAFAALLLVATGSFAASAVKQAQPAKPGSNAMVTAPFSAIEADGNFNIRILSGSPRVELKPDPAIAGCVHAVVRDGILYLSVDQDPKAPPIMQIIPVTIWTTHLNRLKLFGSTIVSGEDVANQPLIIDSEGDNQVRLAGVINIRKLIVHGDSDINLMWVNSNSLLVKAYGNSHIKLAGVTKLLQVKLADGASLDARYLRSKTVLVRTQDSASAEVLAIHSLNAFAYDNSNIYYYKTAKQDLQYTEVSGNVLQLGYWE